MRYTVAYSADARKTLKKLQPKLAMRIHAKLEEVAQDPYAPHNNVKKLQGREGYRLRVGDWRVIYHLQDSFLTLVAIEIGTRGDIYH